MKHPFFYLLMGGLLAATFATHSATDSADSLARKTGGAPERLQEKQRRHYKGTTQPQPELRMARKVGGYNTRLLHQQRLRYKKLRQA